jgi:hypothetical protein
VGQFFWEMPGSRKQISRWRKVFCKGRFFGSELEEAAAW